MADPRTVKRRRSREPFLWALFSSGGMIAALLLPALALLLWIAVPLGWAAAPSHDGLYALARLPVTRLFLFVFVTLAAFHWAHRFRYTLYDGLQLYHLNTLIAVVTYGVATLIALLAAWVVILL
jgi:fumarate reductase subunit D